LCTRGGRAEGAFTAPGLEIRGDLGEIWGDLEEIWGDLGRSGEIWGDLPHLGAGLAEAETRPSLPVSAAGSSRCVSAIEARSATEKVEVRRRERSLTITWGDMGEI